MHLRSPKIPGRAVATGVRCLAMGVCLGWLARAAAADWPMFRGDPAQRGVTTDRLPAAMSLKWSFRTGDPVLSTAAIVDGRVYIGSGDSNVFCLNLADGKPVWTFAAGAPVEASPLVLDGRLFVGDSNTNFFCLDARDGKELWRVGFEDKVKSSANWYSPAVGAPSQILVGSYDFRLYSLDPATGRTNWSYETGNYINGSPAVSDGITAFGGCDALVHVVRLADGTKVREVEAGAYIIGSAAIVDGRAYVGHYDNEFLCVDLVKGEVVWRYRDRAFPYAGSPAVTGDRVIFGGRDKRVHCVDRGTGKAVWHFATRGRVESSPVVADDKVVVGSDDGRVYLLDLATGKELWSYEIGQPVQGSPAVSGDRFVIGCEDGSIYCFGPS